MAWGIDDKGRRTLEMDGQTLTDLEGDRARLTWYGSRWHVVDGNGEEVRELHCGDVVAVRVHPDAEVVCARAEVAEDGWYLLDPATLFIRDELEGLPVVGIFA